MALYSAVGQYSEEKKEDQSAEIFWIQKYSCVIKQYNTKWTRKYYYLNNNVYILTTANTDIEQQWLCHYTQYNHYADNLS